MSRDELKRDLYRRLGFGGDPALMDQLLDQAGLSRIGRQRIASSKADQVKQLIDQHFALVCGRGDCRERAARMAGPLTLAPASASEHCIACSGSAATAALQEMAEACRAVGIARVCIVGGTPNSWQQLRAAVGTTLDLRLIDGTSTRTAGDAAADNAWADLVVLWGATPLRHKISTLYRGPKVISFARRGVQELAREVIKFAGQRGRPAN